MSLSDRTIKAALAARISDREGVFALARRLADGESRLPNVADLRASYLEAVRKDPNLADPGLDRALRRSDVRSVSGVAVVTVLTKPYPCPGQCVYCPDEARMPKSYLSNEPAAMRALALRFDPYRQVTARLRALRLNGHPNDKIELIVKGGTWSSYPPAYRKGFIRRCFEAANDFGARRPAKAGSLEAAQKRNEGAAHRIIGLTLETRPDRITPKEIADLRLLGCTRVEMGVQSLDDAVLRECRRGHGTAAVVRATRLLKAAGFKVDYHLMPQLPGATPETDRESLARTFADPDFRPDMVKVYPCTVIRDTVLYDWWKDGRYRPYPTEDLIGVLTEFKAAIPRYCRISRLIRDIPSPSIEAGNAVTNLRQVIQRRMAEKGLRCRCLRCREIGHTAKGSPKLAGLKPKLFVERYDSSGGTELFLSFEDSRRRAVFAFCRLRLPDGKRRGGSGGDPETAAVRKLLPETAGAALLRELHTYGNLVPIGRKGKDASQHKGLGARLMAEAERLAKKAGYGKVAVISGVGVRGYYRKLGYRRQGTYMVKGA